MLRPKLKNSIKTEKVAESNDVIDKLVESIDEKTVKEIENKKKKPHWWESRKKEILKIKRKNCVVCGTPKKTNLINILNKSYPWEVPEKFLIVLCEECHKENEKIQRYDYDDTLKRIKKNNDGEWIRYAEHIEYLKRNEIQKIPPSKKELQLYCYRNNITIDPEYFFDFYQAKGWMLGSQKIYDWKAVIRLWERNKKEGYDFKNRE